VTHIDSGTIPGGRSSHRRMPCECRLRLQRVPFNIKHLRWRRSRGRHPILRKAGSMNTWSLVAGICVAGILAHHFTNKHRQAKSNAKRLVKSLIENSEEYLGIPVDIDSIIFLSQEFYLAASIWKVVNHYGMNMPYPTLEFDHDIKVLSKAYKDEKLKTKFPCAHTAVHYALHLAHPGLYEIPHSHKLARHQVTPPTEVE
jgi:hypothetical protein